jgi:hypothetical protein
VAEHDPCDGRSDKLRAIAVEVAVRTGLLKKCPLHGDVYDPGQHDYQGALMVAVYLINQSDPLVAPFGGDRLPLAELLKSICGSHARGCPRCSLPSANGVA